MSVEKRASFHCGLHWEKDLKCKYATKVFRLYEFTLYIWGIKSTTVASLHKLTKRRWNLNLIKVLGLRMNRFKVKVKQQMFVLLQHVLTCLHVLVLMVFCYPHRLCEQNSNQNLRGFYFIWHRLKMLMKKITCFGHF